MTDHDPSTGEAPAAALRQRLRDARFPLLAASCLALAAVLWFQVPAPAAIVGVLAIGAAVLLPARRRDQLASAPRRAATGPALWPDTGMKLVVDAIADPCIITDAAGIVRYQNKAATTRLGPPRPGEPLSFKLRVPELLAAVERVGAGEAVEPVHFVERVPTERFSVAAVTAIRSRADRPRADLVLIRLGDETELMRMDRMRGDFIANASHELRTPLASLTGFIETLLGPARDDTANRERFLRIMLEQAGRMARLIDDLLSLSRIEMRAHVRPSAPVDLVALVGQVADMLGPLAREHEVTLTVASPDGPAVVRGDRDELVQVVANLVENAIKYGRAGGAVEISLSRDPVAAGETAGVTLAVSDDGPGIAPEHIPRLTERFYRADAEDGRRQKGTGLGLAIVKHIVNRHRGRLAIRSTLGEGSVFTVWLEDGAAGGDQVEDKPSISST